MSSQAEIEFAPRGQARPAPRRVRRGQALVEFSLVALATYLVLAAILTFGHLLYAAHGVQQAADVTARELSRTPLPADMTFDEALADTTVMERIYSEDYLVVDLDDLESAGESLSDEVATWPLLNQQLFPLMILDLPDLNGDGQPDRRLLRYPGALLKKTGTPTGYTVGIPLVVSRGAGGGETIRWVAVVEEIKPPPSDPPAPADSPFHIASEERGLVALRINYPFQAAAMSSFAPVVFSPEGDPVSNIGQPNVADDDAVIEENPQDRPGDPITYPLEGGGRYAGTYGGRFGLGGQGALGSQELTGHLPVRPYRRVISAQAIYRREVFSAPETTTP